MTFIIVTILLLGYIAIATEHITRINKAATAMFLGVVGWILYMVEGSSYVDLFYHADYQAFLNGAASTATTVKTFIANHIFLRHIAEISQIVLFLLATMAIVDVLNANGCFDFIYECCRTKNSRKLIWYLAAASFIISANLDNLTTTVMMLAIMRKIVIETRFRMIYGSVIVLAANCGGCFTVIGDINSLVLWTKGAVTPTDFSFSLMLPALVAMIIPTYLISRTLPEHINIDSLRTVYRGDDSFLSRWQRILMLFIGIGGLWFIPTFHNITKLPPFVGALCVLAIFWVVNEFCNSSLVNASFMGGRTVPRSLQYDNLQTILYFIGLGLAAGAIYETGAFRYAAFWLDHHIHNIYIVSGILGAASGILDNVALVLSSISMYDILTPEQVAASADPAYASLFEQNGAYWQLISFCGGVGGCLLPIGSIAGYALMKNEHVSIWWYFRMMTGKVLLGWIVGLGIFFLMNVYVF